MKTVGVGICKCGKSTAKARASFWICSCGEKVPVEFFVPQSEVYRLFDALERLIVSFGAPEEP